MKKLLLIDGNSMLFRAYYGTIQRGTMQSSTGVTTNAVYGFSTMLNKAIGMIEPTHILVAFDTGDKTFRHKMYDNYKGTRKEVDPDLVSQFQLVREFIDAFPMIRYEVSGYEADDIIGTISRNASDFRVEILTSDRDMLQLIDDHVDVLLMKRGLTEIKIMNKRELQLEMGIAPTQVVDVKALMGDASDNIPGVPSIGEKTALKLIHQYGTFENIYANKEEVKGKMGEKLREFEDQARLSHDLASIFCDVPINFDLESLAYQMPNETLNAFYRKYDMNSLITNQIEQTPESKEILKISDFSDAFLKQSNSLNLEFNKKNELLGVYIANGENLAYLSDIEMKQNPLFHEMLKQNNLLVSSSKELYHFCLENNIQSKYIFDDLLLLAFIVDPQCTTMDKLKDKHNMWFPEFLEQENGFAFARGMNALALELKETASKTEVLKVYEDIEKPLSPVLAACEWEGIHVNKEVLDDIAKHTKKKMDDLTEKIFEVSGREFNLNSPKQLGEILYDELGLPSKKKRSTAVSVLEALEPEYPIITDILEYRKYSKLYSTYAIGLVKHIKRDGKIHTTFNQHAAQTGRLSSSEPNLQNISVRDEETKMVRSAFISSPGCFLLSIDYSQIELRVLSYMANEEKMVASFNDDRDIHSETARSIFGVENVSSEMRRQAKSVNFGIIYGMSAFGLSNQLDISVKEAQEFINRYNEAFPRINQFMDETINFCEENGFVVTEFGRRRYIPDIRSSNRAVKEFGKRAAMNAPIQGTAADIIKIAMIKCDQALKDNNLKSKMILQVHDELIFDVLESELEIVKTLVEEIMVNIVKWPLKLKVESNVGKTWMDESNA